MEYGWDALEEKFEACVLFLLHLFGEVGEGALGVGAVGDALVLEVGHELLIVGIRELELLGRGDGGVLGAVARGVVEEVAFLDEHAGDVRNFAVLH
nr:hypothetical protein [Tanacetum cinerariifolium]